MGPLVGSQEKRRRPDRRRREDAKIKPEGGKPYETLGYAEKLDKMGAAT